MSYERKGTYQGEVAQHVAFEDGKSNEREHAALLRMVGCHLAGCRSGVPRPLPVFAVRAHVKVVQRRLLAFGCLHPDPNGHSTSLQRESVTRYSCSEYKGADVISKMTALACGSSGLSWPA